MVLCSLNCLTGVYQFRIHALSESFGLVIVVGICIFILFFSVVPLAQAICRFTTSLHHYITTFASQAALIIFVSRHHLLGICESLFFFLPFFGFGSNIQYLISKRKIQYITCIVENLVCGQILFLQLQVAQLFLLWCNHVMAMEL